MKASIRVTPHFVFHDAEGRRWAILRRIGVLLAFALGLLIVLFVRSLFVLPQLRASRELRDLRGKLQPLAVTEERIHTAPAPPSWLAKRARTSAATRPRRTEVRLGFYAPWDPQSSLSLERQGKTLTHLAPEGIYLANRRGAVFGRVDESVTEFAHDHAIELLPLVMNIQGDVWQPEVIENLALGGRARQRRFAERLAAKLGEIRARGALFDLEQLDPQYRAEYASLLGTVREVFQRHELEVWLCIPVGNDIAAFDLDALAGSVDRFVAVLFDENAEKDSPGPIASQPWFEEWLAVLLAHGDPSQWVIGLGAFGYDWKAGVEGEAISFADAMARASLAGEGDVRAGAPHFQPHFLYSQDGKEHTVWFLDAVTFRNQLRVVRKFDAGGVALYRLGTEDPLVWEELSGEEITPAALSRLEPDETVAHIGDGDFLTVQNAPSYGRRRVELAGEVWGSTYLSFPSYPLVYHRDARDRNAVALTFDDGPDPDWTPQVLDTLHRFGVKATFFVTGSNVLAHPELVRRIAAEGHEIGNHSFSHPDLAAVSGQRMTIELNATQRLIEGLTNSSTLLFRPPYNADRRPETYAEFVPLLLAQSLDYTVVSASVDTQDWDGASGAELLSRVKARRHEGPVVLLHDGGGDRSQTVEALPAIIKYLRRRGDTLVQLHDLLGVDRAAVMPPIAAEDPARPRVVAQTGLEVVRTTEELLWAFMIMATVVVLARTAVVLAFALVHRRRERARHAATPEETSVPVSVVVAALNEEKVIGATLRSVLLTDYRGPIEVIVVDDGSTDGTAERVRDFGDGRITLLTQRQSGKARALAHGLRAAHYETIVMLDADTQFTPATIGALVRPLIADAQVAAASGHIKVGNLKSWIARLQALEYVCGFNLDRRAYDILDCITVVPGAVCALRRSAIDAVGGIPLETLAEDTDLTLALHRAHYRIRYAPDAVAHTEAPDSARALLRQRVRWAFGTLQCLWKHRELLFNPSFGALGFFSLPSIWFCHVVLVALVPLIDGLLLVSIITGHGEAVIEYAVVFLLVDFLLAFSACLLEGERLRDSLRFLALRVVYRPLLSIAVWHAILRALKGAFLEWGRLERKGTVVGAAVRVK